MEKKKILVVDDEEMLNEFIKIRLEDNNYIVETATDGIEGLLKAEQVRPDLIILDIFMKPMDGYTMLKEVRRNEKIKDTLVIMLTASGKKKEVFEAEGISDYITKPFDSEDFVARVNKVLKGK
ncbi:MAG: response regulator [Candidatus Omnitrophica bacterium]|nr:response regulator [Candidatus Omnitrophota bacterium]MCK5260003.1 response regulator [Candidatus Omnitrophota bacterium]